MPTVDGRPDENRVPGVASDDATLTNASAPAVSTPERTRAQSIQSLVWQVEEVADFSRRSYDREAAHTRLVELGREDPELLAATLIEGKYLVTSDAREGCHRAVLKALAEIADERTVPAIAAVIRNEDSWYSVRDEAIGTLGAMKCESGIEPLQSVLMDAALADKFRCGAATALVEFGEKSLEILYAVLKPDDEGYKQASEVRCSAIEAIGKIGSPESAPILAEGLVKKDIRGMDEYESVRIAIGKALAAIGKPSVEPLIGCLRQAEVTNVSFVIRAFEEVGPVAVPALVGLLKEGDEKLHDWTVSSIERAGGPEAYLALLEVYKEKSCMHLEVLRQQARGLPDGMKKAMVALLEEIRDLRTCRFPSSTESARLDAAMLCYEAIMTAAEIIKSGELPKEILTDL